MMSKFLKRNNKNESEEIFFSLSFGRYYTALIATISAGAAA